MRPEWIKRPAVNRRTFIKGSAAGASGLILGFFIPTAGRFAIGANAPAAPVFPPNAFLRIAPDNTISVVINRLELGQGVNTALPMILADELDADWALMRSELAPLGSVYNDPAFGMQITAGSGSIAHSFTQYREIGARARAMLIAAAAQRWQLKPGDLGTSSGFVTGPANRKASYGSLAEAAMTLPVPATVVLKDAKQFRYIGKPVRRLDARVKSNGA